MKLVMSWEKTRLLTARHGVIVPMIAFGLVNQNWLLTGGGWQDPWRTFESFTNLGTLSLDAQAHYKSTRTVLVLCGQILLWLLGNYWGQIGLAAVNLIATYLSLRYLLTAIYGRPHPLAVAIVLYLPALHGVGGWMLGVSFSFPLVVVSMALAIQLLDALDEQNNRGKVLRIGVLLGLSFLLIWFVHPGALPALLSALLSALVLIVVLTKRYQVIRRLTSGLLFGGILGVVIGELSGFAIGHRKSTTLSSIDWYLFLIKEENVSAFRQPLTSWLGGATYLAPIGMGLSLTLVVLLNRRRSIGVDRSVNRKYAVLLAMCFIAITFLVLYEISQATVLAYDFYASILVLFGGLLAAASLQHLLENRNNRATPPNRSELLPLTSIVLIIVGWQFAEQLIPIPGTILATVLAWFVVGGILGAGSAKSGIAQVTIWCLGTLMFGAISSEPQYVLRNCNTREIETISILSLVNLAEAGYFQDRFGPVYVIDTPGVSNVICEPSASKIRSSIGDQFPPFQIAGDLQSNAITRPNASTILLGTDDQQVQQVFQVAQTTLGLEDTMFARPVPNITGISALEVFHRDLADSNRLLEPISEKMNISMAALWSKIFTSETYLVLSQLTGEEPEARIAVVATSESDVFASLFRNVLGVSLTTPKVNETPAQSPNVCETIGEFRADVIVVARGAIDDTGFLDLLAKAKAEARDCLGSLGWVFVEEPSNSESPLVIRVGPSK